MPWSRIFWLCLTVTLPGCSQTAPDPPYIGYVEAQWHYVAAPAAGWITSRPATKGTELEAGDLLFELEQTAQETSLAAAEGQLQRAQADARNLATGARKEEIEALEARLAEARARLALATDERERNRPLVARGLESELQGERVEAPGRPWWPPRSGKLSWPAARPAQREAAAAAVAIARAELAGAHYELGLRRVTARLAGRVEDEFLDVGEYATAGAPVLAMLPRDGLKVRFFVPQAELPGLALGHRVSVSADGLEQPVSVPISYIAPDAEFTPPVIYSREARAKLVFLVEAALPAGTQLPPGLPVEVRR